MDSLEFVNDLKDTLITYTCERGTFDTTIYHYHTKEMDQLEKDLLELQKYKKLEEKIGCPLEVRCRLHNGMNIFHWTGKECCVYQIDEEFIKVSVNRKFYQMLVNEPAQCYTLRYEDYKHSWWLKADRSE